MTSLCNLICLCLKFVAASFNRSSSSSNGVSELPTSVILEILLKLPIKTIIQCQSVCKSWHKLISDPYFTTAYCSNPPFTALVRSDHRTILDSLDDRSFCFLEIGINGDVQRTSFNRKAFDISNTGILGLMGSCNGLLCLVDSPQIEYEAYRDNRDSFFNNQSVYVINPVLGEHVLLPRVKKTEYISEVLYGFGSSNSSNEYKVLRMVNKYMFPCTPDQVIKVSGEIFTVGVDNDWRCFEDSSIPCYLFGCGITINGVIHWIGDNRRFGLIYAFDIDTERGNCISLPPGLGDEPGVIVIASWNDNLCLIDNYSEFQVDIWTMKQYGVVESWTRDIIWKGCILPTLRSYPLIPITTMRSGELLMSRPYGRNMISFDPMVNQCSDLEVFDVDGTVSFPFGYTPSFFSLKSVFRAVENTI